MKPCALPGREGKGRGYAHRDDAGGGGGFAGPMAIPALPWERKRLLSHCACGWCCVSLVAYSSLLLPGVC